MDKVDKTFSIFPRISRYQASISFRRFSFNVSLPSGVRSFCRARPLPPTRPPSSPFCRRRRRRPRRRRLRRRRLRRRRGTLVGWMHDNNASEETNIDGSVQARIDELAVSLVNVVIEKLATVLEI